MKKKKDDKDRDGDEKDDKGGATYYDGRNK